jgi:hypothetical protein
VGMFMLNLPVGESVAVRQEEEASSEVQQLRSNGPSTVGGLRMGFLQASSSLFTPKLNNRGRRLVGGWWWQYSVGNCILCAMQSTVSCRQVRQKILFFWSRECGANTSKVFWCHWFCGACCIARQSGCNVSYAQHGN